MIGPDFMDELDCGSFFDHIDDLLVDFSGDDMDAAAGGLAGSKPEATSFPSIWSTQSDSLPNSDSVFSGHSASADLSAELSVPYEDIVQLEWLSNFVEDSFSGGESLTMNNKEQQHSLPTFQTASPISVLESSSSCSGGGEKSSGSLESGGAPGGGGGKLGRARSKRPRPAAFNPRPAIELIASSDQSDSFAESRPEEMMMIKKKKKKIKVSFPARESCNPGVSAAVRKCMHCEITKTPQWRAGPMGPKTLCNACGVRFKSGRLYPEYRPAASPTFLPTVHSNSHKKVLEMRGRGGPADLIPNTNANAAAASLDY